MHKLMLALLAAAVARAQILSWDEYRALAGPHVRILRLQSAAGPLLYYGARHTRDPGDGQVEEIGRLWREFRPTVALVEGGVPPLANGGPEAVTRFGEAGWIRFLAGRDRVAIASLDPTAEEQVAALLRTFPPDRVKLFYFLRYVADLRQDPARRDRLDEFAAAELTRLSDLPGLHDAPRSLRDIAAAVPQWRETPASWFDPLKSEAFTNEVDRELSQIRNRHMVKVVIAEVSAGARVFAVAGGTHLAMQEPALRSALQ